MFPHLSCQLTKSLGTGIDEAILFADIDDEGSTERIEEEVIGLMLRKSCIDTKRV